MEEETPDVKVAIIDSLQKVEVTEESFAASMQTFVEEQDDSVRFKIAKYLITASLKFPEGRKAIKELMSLEHNPQVYEVLARASQGSG
jgi:hypothetical protein